MPVVSDVIPAPLQPPVDAAVAWFNTTSEAAGDEFKATGILDPDDALGASGKLQLILCGGGRCEQHSFRVSVDGGIWEVGFADSATHPTDADRLQAELDPPPGARRSWLDLKLEEHDFVLLLFYRGFW